MKGKVETIGFGGGCHWCTEAVFNHLIGVNEVEQGWLSSQPPNDSFSEAVELKYCASEIPLEVLVEIHLRTHSATSNHSFRAKYRSAIYYYNDDQYAELDEIMMHLQKKWEDRLITKILKADKFKLNTPQYLNYYQKNRENGFCRRFIDPKLKAMMQRFSKYYTDSIEKTSQHNL